MEISSGSAPNRGGMSTYHPDVSKRSLVLLQVRLELLNTLSAAKVEISSRRKEKRRNAVTHAFPSRSELQFVALGTGVIDEEPVGLCVVALVGTDGFVGGGDGRVGDVGLWGSSQ
jgi:hypothetical protein